MANNKALITSILSKAGITINGKDPWDIHVLNDNFYTRAFEGTLGLGESYMNGDWDCDQIDVMISKIIQTDLKRAIKPSFPILWQVISSRFSQNGHAKKSKEVAEKHYNLGNDLFQAMLDKRLVYTCAYWKNATNLDEAQEAKLDLVCKKLGLKPGMRVLDIGGGWGSFAKFAAEKYGVSVVNITVSKEQVALANKLCKGLSVENRLMDYRSLHDTEKFDRIVSLGMFEHVNQKFYRTYFEVARRNLKDNGLFLLHTIGRNLTSTVADPWIQKYIFPNSMLPSMKQITSASEGLFIIEDWHNFGPYYDKTLMAWHENFEKAWPKLKKKYPEQFYRMWRLYLMSCAAAFRARKLQLWQIVLSKNGVVNGYQSVR